jgi:homoserine O-acetyltransferase
MRVPPISCYRGAPARSARAAGETRKDSREDLGMRLSHLLRRTAAAAALAALVAVPAMPALAYDEPVEKREFVLENFTTEQGETIPEVRIGWEAYGEPNEARDNAILVTHYFSGTSAAAGKYTPEQEQPGYWNAIIGPGKPVDTDKYYVISSDTLVNLNVADPNVVTTGPATTNPETGEPYGMDFPVVSMADFVAVQKALLDSLGIETLHAVMGASGGSVQAMQWAAQYPDMVPRAIAVIAPGLETPAYVVGMLKLWNMPIMLDPNWNGGDYYDGTPPNEGLSGALQLVTLNALYFDWAADNFGRAPAEEGTDPEAEFDNAYKVEAALAAGGDARAAKTDANHFLYMSKANQTFSVADRVEDIQAKVLFVPAEGDMIFPPFLSEQAAETLRVAGKEAEVFTVTGPFGHLNGIFNIGQAGEAIAAFLSE